MEYFLDHTKTPLPEELDEFWYEERNEWDDETESVFKTLNYSNYKERRQSPRMLQKLWFVLNIGTITRCTNI